MRNAKLIAVYALLAMVCLVINPASDTLCREKESAFFKYSGYSEPEYTSFTRSAEYAPMSDGAKLAVTKYLPSDGSYPVILVYLPYQREGLYLDTGELAIKSDPKLVEFFTSYGYAVVFADIRGKGASYGSLEAEMSPQIAEDGKELIDWIEAQSWCDGNVGMIGLSYHGWSQYASAGKKPAALKAIIPEIMYFDAFTSACYYPGGIYNKHFGNLLTSVFSIYDKNNGKKPTAPAVDEDDDGDLTDEIPLDLNGNGSFVDDYKLPDNPPQYKDGQERQHIYYKATLEHSLNPVYNKILEKMFFRDAFITDYITPEDLGPADYPVGMSESGIAVYNFGGWFDAFARGTTQWFSTLKATNPVRMMIGPGIHNSPGYHSLSRIYPVASWEYFGENLEEVAQGYNIERLRFFDRYLKGIENGIDTESPVKIYVMNGEGWRSENEWPLEREIRANLYFEKDKSLSIFPKSVGSDDYQADFTHDSREEASLKNRYTLGRPKNMAIRTDKDLKCLTYTLEPLKTDVEVTGHPIVHLQVSSTADYGDFFVYLEDVDENGEAYLVTDGLLRAGFAGLLPNEDMLPDGAGLDVLPDLPWHGFKESDYVDRIFAGGSIVEVTFDLMPTSWVFKKGHRIRVSIAAADWPTFRLHPELSPANDPADPGNIVPTITVHRSFSHRSYIELPVIPKKKMKYEKALKWLGKQF
jgi:hypothetical protein